MWIGRLISMCKIIHMSSISIRGHHILCDIQLRMSVMAILNNRLNLAGVVSIVREILFNGGFNCYMGGLLKSPELAL